MNKPEICFDNIYKYITHSTIPSQGQPIQRAFSDTSNIVNTQSKTF